MVARRLACLALVLTVAPAGRADDPARFTERIDARLAEKWKEAEVSPTQPCDDATFLRRLHLDLTGTIPSAFEARRFLADTSPDKRDRAIDTLLSGPGFVRHFSASWRALLLGENRADPDLDAWLRVRVAARVPYDRLVREILTQPGDPPPRGEPSARAFFRGRESKPDELASSVTRLFLGVRLECAQCHDHPFAGWKREQFWNQAAFFTRDEKPVQEIPGLGKVVPARFLDGRNPEFGKRSPRQVFAEWLTTPDNPYFARAAVNRVWGSLFGIGLVEPVDDFNDANPPSHPELLDELAREFAAQKFDLVPLLRGILRSRAYQFSSRGGVPAVPPLFERRAVRLLTPDQMLDSFVQATGVVLSERQRAGLQARFPRTESQVDAAPGIPQALALMNGPLARLATDPRQASALAAVVEAPYLDPAGKVEALFLATLTRPPHPPEAKRFLVHVDGVKTPEDVARVLGDVLWALLNSAEFLHNH